MPTELGNKLREIRARAQENMQPTFGARITLEIPSHGERIAKPYVLQPHPEDPSVGIRYYSERYGRWITVPHGFRSDGATFALDIRGTVGWEVHDWLCVHGCFDDGTSCTNWMGSMILTDILDQDKYKLRRWYWFWFTFLFGGGVMRAKMI